MEKYVRVTFTTFNGEKNYMLLKVNGFSKNKYNDNTYTMYIMKVLNENECTLLDFYKEETCISWKWADDSVKNRYLDVFENCITILEDINDDEDALLWHRLN
jgi:hypothetical protein